MGEAREENERLKNLLSKMMKDYQSLQTKFNDILQQQEHNKKPAEKLPSSLTAEQKDQDSEMVSLRLGINSSDKEESKISNNNTSSGKIISTKEEGKSSTGGLGLGLDCKFEPEAADDHQHESSLKNNLSSESTFEEQNKEEEPSEAWPPSKVLKTMRSGGDEEVLQQNPLKKPRVCVRARCDSATVSNNFFTTN